MQNSRVVSNRLLVAVFALSVGACAVDVGEPDDDDSADVVEIDSLAPTMSGNYIGNAGFESPISGVANYGMWAGYGDQSTSSKYSGTYSMYVKAGNASTGSWPSESQFQKIPGSKTYVLSAWVRNASGKGYPAMKARITKTSGAAFNKVVYAGTSTSWHQISLSFTAPSDIYDVQVMIGDLDADGAASYWDNVSLRYNLD